MHQKFTYKKLSNLNKIKRKKNSTCFVYQKSNEMKRVWLENGTNTKLMRFTFFSSPPLFVLCTWNQLILFNRCYANGGGAAGLIH